MSTEEPWAQMNSSNRGTVSTEEQWVQRKSGHRGTAGDRNSGLQLNYDEHFNDDCKFKLEENPYK